MIVNGIVDPLFFFDFERRREGEDRIQMHDQHEKRLETIKETLFIYAR